MGIKFHCPQGHKLNVKAFLAGKKGVCPKCGTKVRIPLVSEAALANSEVEETDAAESPVKSNGSGKVAAPAVAVSPAASLPGGDGEHDPIAEAPTAIWYVRPPTGGQYGPARGDVMRKWVSEGRVSSDSLVWREGWTDWQSAGTLFPALQSAGAATPQPVMPAVSTIVGLSPRATQRVAAKFDTKKSDSNAVAIGMLVGLGLVCLVLMVVLALVWFNLR